MVAKKLLTVLCISAFAFTAFAQDGKRVYLGARLGAGVGLSALDQATEDLVELLGGEITRGGGSFDIAPFVSLQLADVFALQTELLFTKFGAGQKISIMGYEAEQNIAKSAMVIPILAKLTFRPENLSISAFVGPHFTANIGKWNVYYKYKEPGVPDIELDKKYTDDEFKVILSDMYEDMEVLDLPKFAPVGLTAGVSFGFNAGPGNVFLDIRYLTDLGMAKIKVEGENNAEIETDWMRRAKLSFTVGYEIGAGSR